MPRFYKFDYAISNADGDIVDSSDGAEPLSFVEGDGRVIRGLEIALRGKEQGDEFDVAIGPDDAYGWPKRALIRTVSRDQVDASIDDIEAGMILQVGSGDEAEVVRVVEVDENSVTIDANHPLAGITFHFHIQVLEAREATEADLVPGATRPR